MMHKQRCGNGCQRLITRPAFPCGGCELGPITHKLTTDRRVWIEIVGCVSYIAPGTNINGSAILVIKSNDSHLVSDAQVKLEEELSRMVVDGSEYGSDQ